MQGNSPWYTPPSSALHNDPNNSNYFFNFNHWNRPSGNYDTRLCSNHQPMSNVRTDTFGVVSQSNSHQNNYDCSQMFYRQNPGDYDVGSTLRMRHDRSRTNISVHVPQDNALSGFEKQRNPKPCTKTSDISEVENFSLVFTQSLTSLYSQDVDGNFAEEKTFGDDRVTIPCAKIKTEDISNDGENGYDFGTVFEEQNQNSPALSFENVKIKTEPFTRESEYENFPVDNRFVRRRRGTLAEAYSRKRKHSAPTGGFTKAIRASTNEDKSPRVFQPESQWIPNSIATGESSVATTYQQQQHEFQDKFTGYENTRFNKRHPMKSRAARGRAEHADVKPVTVCKKIAKKISALTVYAKVVDERIIDVTCRRYKKRSKPKASAEGSGEEGTSSSIGHAVFNSKNYSDVYDLIGGMLDNLVDQVSMKVERAHSRHVDLSSLSEERVDELFFKFCHDYALDFRDFKNGREIINSDVTKNREETHRKRRKDRSPSNIEELTKKRRGRSSEKEESVDRKVEKIKEKVVEKEPEKEKVVEKEQEKEKEKEKEKDIIEEKPEKTKPKPAEKPKPKPKTLRSSRQREVESPPPRVLRSLPSRQPQPPCRKTRSNKNSQPKSRYPKRNLRSKKNTTTSGGHANTRANKKLKILIDLSKENEPAEEVLEVDSDVSCAEDTNPKKGRDSHNTSDSETESSTEKSKGSRKKESPETNHREPVIKQEDESNTVTIVDQTTDTDMANGKFDFGMVKQEIQADADEDEDFGLRQPPQLVRMTDDNNATKDNNGDTINIPVKEKESSDELSTNNPGSNESNSKSDHPPPTLQPNENFTSMFFKDPSGSSASVSDKEQQDNAEERCDKEPEGAVLSAEVPKSDAMGFLPNMSLIPAAAADPFEYSSEDDCIDKRLMDPHTELVKTDSNSTRNILKEKLMNKALIEKIERSSCADGKNIFLPTSMKSLSREEQDESILRTLLLETEGVSNSGVVKERESHSTSNPFVSSINSLSEKEALSALNPLNSDAENLSESSVNSMSPVQNDSTAENKLTSFQLPLQLPQSYHEGYSSMISPEIFEDIQKNFKYTSSQLTRLLSNRESKKTFMVRKPSELLHLIHTVDKDIAILCDLLSQKDKEKMLIMYMARQKEDLLDYLKKFSAGFMKTHQYSVCVPMVKNTVLESQSSSSSDGPICSVKSTTSFGIIDSTKPINPNSCMKEIPLSSSMSRPHSTQASPKAPAAQSAASAPAPPEKVSTVATMVANATDNYGLDMTNIGERLRYSPENSTSGAILQKALSSSGSSRNSTPEIPFVTPPWSPDRICKTRNVLAMTKAGATSMIHANYQDQYNISLDGLMSQASRLSPVVENRTTNGCVTSPEISTVLHTVSEQSQVQTSHAEPVHIKTQRNTTFRSWSIQSGGRIGEERSGFTKPVHNMSKMVSSHGIVPSIAPPPPPPSSSPDIIIDTPPGRQMSCNKGRPLQNFGLSATSIKQSFYVNSHRTVMPGKMETRTHANTSSIHTKKMDEDRRRMNYGTNITSLSSGSAMPYGGHIIHNSTSLTASATITTPSPSESSSTSNTPLCMGCGLSESKYVCSRCRQHWYCSAHCQSVRWPEHSSKCFPPDPNRQQPSPSL